MTQAQLNRAVARATGESLDCVRHRGFSPLRLPRVVDPPEQEAQSVDAGDPCIIVVMWNDPQPLPRAA